MLRITFTPPGDEPRLFELTDPTADVTALEAEDIEEAGGKQWDTFMGWAMLMSSGGIRAVRVLLWILLRRENPALKLEEFDFPVNSLSVEEIDDMQPCRVCGGIRLDPRHTGEHSHEYDPVAEPEGKDEPADSATSGT
jgi:hypothetical protein